MNRTSRDIERKILDLHFQGYSRDAIARIVGVPPSTVSEVITLLPDVLSPLRDLSVELRKRDLSVFEAEKGTELRARLDDLGVKFEKLQSFVESAEKMRTNPDYEPKQVVQGAMKLSDLEKESSKTYPQTLLDFEETNNGLGKLKTIEKELTQRISTLKTERRRKLAENGVTETEIAYTRGLRQNFLKCGIYLEDVEGLKKYLQNIAETGGNPRKFVEYTKEHGSLKRRTALLQQEEQEHALNLNSLREKEESARNVMNRSLSVESELDRQNNEEQKKLLAVRKDIAEAREEYRQELAKLGQILKVEAEEKKINEAMDAKDARLQRLNSEINEKEAGVKSLQQRELELQNRDKNLEREIQEKLGIRDYATQLSSAVATLEHQKMSLAKENNGKKAKIAVADTVTAFLTQQTPYDFHRFCSYIDQMKTMRESKTHQTSLNLRIAEEQARSAAMEAFKGCFATTGEYHILKYQKEMSDKANAELEMKVRQVESKLEETGNELESVRKEKQLVEAVRANFEGHVVTIGEIKDWVLSLFSEEIQKRVEQKYNAGAAAVQGVLDFVLERIKRRANMWIERGQQ